MLTVFCLLVSFVMFGMSMFFFDSPDSENNPPQLLFARLQHGFSCIIYSTYLRKKILADTVNYLFADNRRFCSARVFLQWDVQLP